MEDFAEAVYKGLADMRFTKTSISVIDAHHGQFDLPVVAHGVEDGIVKLNWPRNEQRWVWLLV